MVIISVAELEVAKAPPEVYAMGTSAEVTLRNSFVFPWKYFLRVEYVSEEKLVDSEQFSGWLKGRKEETIHSETAWSADLVRAKVGTTQLLLLPDTREVDP